MTINVNAVLICFISAAFCIDITSTSDSMICVYSLQGRNSREVRGCNPTPHYEVRLLMYSNPENLDKFKEFDSIEILQLLYYKCNYYNYSTQKFDIYRYRMIIIAHQSAYPQTQMCRSWGLPFTGANQFKDRRSSTTTVLYVIKSFLA